MCGGRVSLRHTLGRGSGPGGLDWICAHAQLQSLGLLLAGGMDIGVQSLGYSEQCWLRVGMEWDSRSKCRHPWSPQGRHLQASVVALLAIGLLSGENGWGPPGAASWGPGRSAQGESVQRPQLPHGLLKSLGTKDTGVLCRATTGARCHLQLTLAAPILLVPVCL